VAWYVRGLPHSARVREQVNRTRSVAEMTELLRGYLAELERAGAAGAADAPARDDAGAVPAALAAAG
jgi:uncharacterized protein YdeI (YjbR/CyaY-like superfamily)